tara:strand:+ start:70 stop:537 length:468 start_codon:yes stop_codon:yes gene_type:complete
MKLEVNVSKKYAFMILAAVLIVGGVLGVIAYNSGLDPDVMGHSDNEIHVDLDGDGTYDKTLQEAIVAGDFGGGGAPALTFYSAGGDKNDKDHDVCSLIKLDDLNPSNYQYPSNYQFDGCSAVKDANGNWDLSVEYHGFSGGSLSNHCEWVCMDWN